MELLCAGFLLLQVCSTLAGFESFVRDPASDWQRMEPEKPRGPQRTHAPMMRSSPPTNGASPSTGSADLYKPEKGARPLPQSVQEMLLSGQTGGKMIDVRCDAYRMVVGVRRDLFLYRDAGKDLYLGTCRVNQISATYYILNYLLSDNCGFQGQIISGGRAVFNILNYKPEGPVVRDAPFSIRLLCHDQKSSHSFATGFYPVLEGGTVYKQLQTQSTLYPSPPAPPGAPVIELLENKAFNLGEPIYFQARQPSLPPSPGRIYINKCYVTSSSDASSYPRYTVIANQGCMMDGKVAAKSAFLRGPSMMVQRISVAAMILKGNYLGQSQQLYMHCEISVGQPNPTPYAKACNYDPATASWKELYGDDSVCSCCDHTCALVPRATQRKVVSSPHWEVSSKLDTEDPEKDLDFDFDVEADMEELEEDLEDEDK